MKLETQSPRWLGGLLLLWGSVAVLGSLFLGFYHAQPGRAGAPPETWPRQALPPLDRSLPTLLIFIHPRCPCSPASLAELAEVAARCSDRFAAHLLAYEPDSSSADWKRSTDESQGTVPGLTRWADPGGREAKRFGVETSGHVLLYNPAGQLLYSGGITQSRGHQGANRGLENLIATIRHEWAESRQSPVFGCSVRSSERPFSEGVLP